MDRSFTVYAGKFLCKQCGVEVTSLRYWPEGGNVTWMCSQKHISKVVMIPPKKKKSDFNNE